MYDGHDPRAIEEYPMQDILLYLRVRPELIPLLGGDN